MRTALDHEHRDMQCVSSPRQRPECAHRNPPQRDVHTGEILEPLLSLAKQFYVRCVIDEMSEVLDSFPYRHIHEDLIVVIRSKVCSVSFGGLKPPHEARI